MTKIGRSEMTFGAYSYAIVVKNHGQKIKSGLKQRDAAVMAGAEGVTTMLFKKGRLVFPSTNTDMARFSKSFKANIPSLDIKGE